MESMEWNGLMYFTIERHIVCHHTIIFNAQKCLYEIFSRGHKDV